MRPEASNALKVFKSLAKFGAPLEDVTPGDFATEGLVFQIGVEPVRIDILMSIDGLAFGKAWLNKRRVDLGGVESWVISPEDLIVNKTCSARHQDLADAENTQTSLGTKDQGPKD